MTRRRFCARPYDDRGTTLVLALIFITVGSLIVMAVLALADTGMRSAIVLRSHASDVAAADGAANIAINALRKGSYGGSGNCFGGSNDLAMSNFYERPDGTLDSARVACELDTTGQRTTAPAGTPPRAVLTVETLSGPTGISVTSPIPFGSTPGTLRVTGDVHSNSNIDVQKRFLTAPGGNLTSSGTIRARLGCTSPTTGLFSLPLACNTGIEVPRPVYPTPDVTLLTDRVVPACQPTMVFQPGRYTDVLSLIQRTSLLCQGGNGVLHFTPGIYYFDFQPSNSPVPITWLVTAGTVVGGALRPGVTLGPSMPIPNSCKSPIASGTSWQAPDKGEGVTFVFSGVSQMAASSPARVELCGRYGGNDPPIAITAEPATALGTSCANSDWPCAAVVTSLPAPNAFVVQGTIYLPDRELILGMSSSVLSVRGGVIARRLWAVTTRTSGAAVIEIPNHPYTERRTVVNLNVYVCPNSPTCTSTQITLKAKVSIVDPSGLPEAGQRQMTVLSWSPQI